MTVPSDGQFPDLPAQHPSIALSATRGVLGAS